VTLAVHADRKGLTLPATVTHTCEAVFDGRSIWSFKPAPVAGQDTVYVPWPTNMRPFLKGVAHLEVRSAAQVYDAGEVVFGSKKSRRVKFVDAHGIPIVIDKWGIIQRPFSARGEKVTSFMADYAERVMKLLADECGVHLWMAFGTLLGAARGGAAIAHDSDMDFAYLSDKATPAEMARELYAMKRVLTRAGMKVINKTGSFITVAFDAPDGGPASLDIYTTFYVSGLLHETATVRADVPREAILPLGELEFEGRMLPAPADPDALLAASYGPRWRTPDPGFKHKPGPDIVQRFDGWFGTLMRQRREWEVYWRDGWRKKHDTRSGFREWVAEQIPADATVVELGAGRGADALAFAQEGHRVLATDYARQAFKAVRKHPQRRELPVTVHPVNLYDTRDALTMAALMTRSAARPRVVYARNILDALSADGRENLWRFASMVLRGEESRRMYVEFDDDAPVDQRVRFHGSGGRKFPVSIDQLEADWTAFGAVEVERHGTPIPETDGGMRWRIVLDWSVAGATQTAPSGPSETGRPG